MYLICIQWKYLLHHSCSVVDDYGDMIYKAVDIDFILILGLSIPSNSRARLFSMNDKFNKYIMSIFN